MTGSLTPTNDIGGEMTATVAVQVVADGIEVAVHQTGIPDALPDDDSEAGLSDSLGNLADIEGC